MKQIDGYARSKEMERQRQAAQAEQDESERLGPAAYAAAMRQFGNSNPPEPPPARPKHRHAKELEPLATERQLVHDQTIARMVIDRAIKRGKLDVASLTADYTRAVGRRDALGWLQRAAQNVLDGQLSASEADYALARALFDD